MEAKWGAKKCPGRVSFFCQQYETTFRQLRNGRFSPNSATTRESWVKRRIRTEIYEKFSFRRHLPPKPQTLRGSNRYLHSEQAAGQGIGPTLQRDTVLFHVVGCSPGAMEFPTSVNFSVRRTVTELRGFKFAQFSDFGLFFHTKPVKRTFR